MQAKNLKDDIGCSYVGWAANHREGAIQITTYGGAVEVAVMGDKTDIRSNSKIYRFDNYKVANAALETISAVTYGCDGQYHSFGEVADVMEMIFDALPAESVKKNKPKKSAE